MFASSPPSSPTFAWLDGKPSGWRSMSFSTRFIRLLVPCCVIFILLFTILPLSNNSLRSSLLQKSQQWRSREPSAVNNATLGLEKIYAIALPESTDRIEAIKGAATATNLTLDIVEALRDENVPSWAIPPDWGHKEHGNGELGCLMSHVKIWRHMVSTNVTSALIMESDADWDMRIRTSMMGLAEATKALVDWPFNSETPSHPRNFTMPFSREEGIVDPTSPYGQNWDVLWVGHCGASANGNGRIYGYEDPSAMSDERALVFKEGPSLGHRPQGNETRIVFQFDTIMCTAGYAISNSGARKLDASLRNGTVEGGGVNDEPVDRWMWNRCRWDLSLACLAVWPQIISPAATKSTIGHTSPVLDEGKDDSRVGPGQGIQISARVNGALGLASAGEDGWKREFDTLNPSKEEKEKEKEEEQKADG